MEPNKMEEDFRKKLNAREIQPSEAAWDRLDAMLSVAENKKPKRNNTFLFIAASLALFFAVGLFLLQQENANPEIRLTNPTVGTSDEKQPVLENQQASEAINNVTEQVISEGKKYEAIAENQPVAATKKNKASETKTNTDFQQQTAKEEIVEVTPKKEPETQKATADTEKLLAIADVPKEKPQVKVNANSLLSSVEGELNQEFRETTLQRLNRNFKTVKTAVANRNYE
ncbi:hypothetical protein [Flavobacterium saliperosum]|uniref:Uncharacterized protein n=1 Tax=Flavobacterium saliperosum TaxID=329186 RepID=A0A1G4V5X1_9FLAO|nr:hypothetical protein [Flavobacterium saliperosum]SCX01738.1 hypothetical protein SAMN02927925_00391 [Flavobacterium saliperosum]